MLVATLLTLVASLGWAAYVFRMRIREHLHLRRTERIGHQNWFEVIQESARKADSYGAESFDGVRALAQFLNGFSGGKYLARPRVTFAWLRDGSSTEGLMRLYVGVNSESGESGRGALNAYARSIGARLKPAERIVFPDQNVVVARRSRSAPGQVADTVSAIGVVANSIAATADSVGITDTSAVFVSLDGMGKSERSLLHSAIQTDVVRAAGNSSMFASGVARSVDLMSAHSVRLGLGAANIGGDEENSKSLLSMASAATSTLGYELDIDSARSAHIRDFLMAGLPLMVLAGLMFIFGVPLAGAVGVVVAIATLAGFFLLDESFTAPLARAAARGEVMLPDYLPKAFSPRLLVESAWQRFRLRGVEDGGSQDGSLDPTGFPSPPEVLTAHSSSLFELLTFAPDATLTASDKLQSRGLPPNMVHVDEGIFVGVSGTGQPVLLDIDDIHYTLYTAGAPNSGKSNLLLVMYAGMVKASRERTAGMKISPIWGETKGEGAYDAWRIARQHPGAVFVDVHNPFPSGARLALEGRRLSEGESVPNVVSNCTRLVSSLQAAYGDGIKSAAREIFDNVLRCAMLMTPEEIEFAGLADQPFIDPQKPNIMEIAYYLLLGDSRIDPSGKMIALGGTLSRSSGLRETELSQAIGSMSRFWEPSTRRTYLERMSTVLNKINDMRNARTLWTPDTRQDIYVGQLVESFAPAVINMGSYYDAETRQFDQSVERAVSQRLIRSFNYLLWDYIKARCNGWQAEGKRIPMFFDEVADVAANAEGDDVPNTLEEGTKEGRSRGAAYFLGSQYPSQMPDMVRHQVLASRGKFWFGLQNSSDISLAVEDLMVGESDTQGAITPGNIKSLNNGVCFATLPRAGAITPPILLKVPYAPLWIKMLFSPENTNTGDAIADYMEHMARQEEGASA